MDIDIKAVLAIVVNDCKKFLNDYSSMGMIISAIVVFFYCAILLCRAVCLQENPKDSIIHACIKVPFIALFGFYSYLVLSVTVLSRAEEAAYILNLTPFSTWGTDIWNQILWIENILMLIPLGILLYILWKPFRKIGWSMLAGFLFSLSIECTQLFNRLGKFEVDDIMNNVLGTMIGFMLCKSVDRLAGVFKN